MMTNDMTNDRPGRGLAALLGPDTEMTIASARQQIGEILEATVAHESGIRTRAIAAELAAAQGRVRTLDDRIMELEQAFAQRDAETTAMEERLRAERAANRRRLDAIAQIAAEGIASAAEPETLDAASRPDATPQTGPVHEPGDRMLQQPEGASSPTPAAARPDGDATTTAARRPCRASSAPASPSPRDAEADATGPVNAGDTTVEIVTMALPADITHACSSLVADGVFPDLDALVVAALRQFLAEPPCSISSDADGPDGRDPAPAHQHIARSPARQAVASLAASAPARCGA